MAERWFAFKAYNTQTMYGYGTKNEASDYEDYLNKNKVVNFYHATPINDPAKIGNGIEFNIGDELQALKEA